MLEKFEAKKATTDAMILCMSDLETAASARLPKAVRGL
jgi:hypothetical protein